MKIHIPERLILVAVVVIGVFILLGFFSIASRLNSLQQPVLSRHAMFETRTIPMPQITLKPGTVISDGDIGNGQWPIRQFQNDIILSCELIVGRVVQKEIKASTLVRSSALEESDESQAE